MQPHQIRVLIWGCSSFTTAAILNVLDKTRRHEVVGCVRTVDELFDATYRMNPAILIFDADHEHDDPLNVISTFRAEFVQCPVLGISLQPNEGAVLDLLGAGALGFLSKARMPDHLKQCIDALISGESWVDTSAVSLQKNAEQNFQDRRREFDAIDATSKRKPKEGHALRTEDAHW